MLAAMAPLYFLLAVLQAGLAFATQCESIQPKAKPQTARDVEFKVLVNGLSRPRGVITDSEGNVLVVEGGGKGIRRIELDDEDGLDTCVTKSAQLVDDKSVSAGP
jgi:glucose/arabinose dehydrogenase